VSDLKQRFIKESDRQEAKRLQILAAQVLDIWVLQELREKVG
jgi:hypothetical protein